MVISAQQDPQVRTHRSQLEDASVGRLTAQLTEQLSRLIRDELALAQLEAKGKAKKLGLGVGMLGVSGVLALFGAACGVAAAVLALATLVAGWLAAVIVGGALFVVAGAIALVGLIGVRRGAPPVPTDAVRSAKADVAAVREAVRR